MHSWAFGAAARMVFRSRSSAVRLSSLNAARYSSMVLGLAGMTVTPEDDAALGDTVRRRDDTVAGLAQVVLDIFAPLRILWREFAKTHPHCCCRRLSCE